METDRLDYYERLLRMKPVFERLFQIAHSKILQSVQSGRDSTYFKVTKGKRSREWSVDADTLIAKFGAAIKVPPVIELRTPAAAEKFIDKGDLKPFIKWQEGSPVLKPKSDIANEISINANEFN